MALNWFTRKITLWNWLAAAGIVATLAMAFLYAPVEVTMGNVQRIFYFHVGSAWVASVTFFVSLVSGILYLRGRRPLWDTISLASVEIGIVFIMMTIVSGSVWGRPAWNTWWLWSPRLTSVTIMWLVYIAYLVLRGAIDDPERKRRFSAVYVIAAFVTVVVTYGSIRILRDIHPVMFGPALEQAQGMEQGLQEFDSGLASMKMGITLTMSTIGFTLLYIAWLANRLRLQGTKDALAEVKMRILARL